MKNPLCDMLVSVINELVIITTQKKWVTHQNKENMYITLQEIKRLKKRWQREPWAFLLYGESFLLLAVDSLFTESNSLNIYWLLFQDYGFLACLL